MMPPPGTIFEECMPPCSHVAYYCLQAPHGQRAHLLGVGCDQVAPAGRRLWVLCGRPWSENDVVQEKTRTLCMECRRESYRLSRLADGMEAAS